ncbi:MAG: hypothetical protein V4556_11705 [Bacteroidota bacterium]
MKYYLLIVIALLVIVSCNNDPKKTSETIITADTAKEGEMKIMIPGTVCYATTGSKDSVFLKVEAFPNVVTGNLSYKIFEKDSNKGTIDGVMRGDTLIADYTFNSEGMSSIRQVAFLIKNNTATEGYGEVEEKNGKMIFKDIHTLDFTKGIKLQVVPCEIGK